VPVRGPAAPPRPDAVAVKGGTGRPHSGCLGDDEGGHDGGSMPMEYLDRLHLSTYCKMAPNPAAGAAIPATRLPPRRPASSASRRVIAELSLFDPHSFPSV